MMPNQPSLKLNTAGQIRATKGASRFTTRFALPSLMLFLAACVTINVYFPEAAATKAADGVVCEVLGTCDDKTSQPAGNTNSNSAALAPQQQAADSISRRAVTAVGMVLNAVIPAAHAQADLDVDSAGARQLRSGMAQRQQQMQPYLDSGAIGFTNDGKVTVRDLGAVSLPKRAKLRQLVTAENNDRSELYAEIARINGHPEWLGKIQTAFAERWIARASAGWYYQNGSGGWVQK